MIRAFVLAAALLVVSAQSEVTLRDASAPIVGSVQGADVGGIAFAPDQDGRRVVIAWDMVREVAGPGVEACRPFQALADSAWRARSRAERSDWAGAEPLLEELFTQVRGGSGPTVALVAEASLRARLRHNDTTGAVVPWLELVRARRERPENTRWVGGALEGGLPALDPDTLLAPSLPPVWLDRPLANDLPGTDASDPVVRTLALLYEAAMTGADAPVPPEGAIDHRGVRLAHSVVAGVSSDPAAREQARAEMTRLLEDAESMPRWQEAWCRVGLGRSLAMEADETSRRRGAIQLLFVPARFGPEQAYLASVALRESARILDGLGDASGAARLREELARRFPGSSPSQPDPGAAPPADPSDAAAQPQPAGDTP